MKKLLISAIVAASALTASAASANSAWTQHGVTLNARSGPGTNYHVIGSFNPCTSVHVVGHQHGWAKVSYNNHYYWVSSKYLQNHACNHSYTPPKKKHYSGGGSGYSGGSNY